jgi:FeS assembly SUF system protein
MSEPSRPDQPTAELRDQIIAKLRTCYDPEIPVDIYELGLIYSVQVAPDGRAQIKMTLTSPMCPAAQTLPVDVKEKAESVEGIENAEVEIVWDPSWSPEMMSEAARLQLGLF